MKKHAIIIAILVLIASIGYKPVKNFIAVEQAENQREETLEIASNDSTILDVGFICQAPLQTEENWIHHEESCEEAATLQTILYERGESITPEEADREILAMIEWQEQYFGGHFDLYADQMKEFITKYYSLQEHEVIIINNTTLGVFCVMRKNIQFWLGVV